MPASAFDTLKAMRALTAAEAKEPLAEAIVTTMNEAVAGGAAAGVKTELAGFKSEIAKVNGRLDAIMAQLDSIQWMLGFLVGMQLLMAGRMFGVF